MNEPRIYGFYEFYKLKKQHLLMLWGYAPKMIHQCCFIPMFRTSGAFRCTFYYFSIRKIRKIRKFVAHLNSYKSRKYQ